jgi:hypothetical protein
VSGVIPAYGAAPPAAVPPAPTATAPPTFPPDTLAPVSTVEVAPVHLDAPPPSTLVAPTNAELQAQLAALTAKLDSIPEPEKPAPPKAAILARCAELTAAGVSGFSLYEQLGNEGYPTHIPVSEHGRTIQTLVTIVDALVAK